MADNQVAMNRDIPSFTELLRELELNTTANIGLAYAKAGYLTAETESLRLGMVENLATMDLGWLNSQRETAMGILVDSRITDEGLRADAKSFLSGFMNKPIPSKNIPQLFKQLGHGLPTISQISDVFLHAPALAPGNPFDLAQAIGNLNTPGAASTPPVAGPSTNPGAAPVEYSGPLVNSRARARTRAPAPPAPSH